MPVGVINFHGVVREIQARIERKPHSSIEPDQGPHGAGQFNQAVSPWLVHMASVIRLAAETFIATAERRVKA